VFTFNADLMSFRFLYRGLRARFRDERAETGFLIENTRPGDTVIDCGANKGSYLWALSRAVGKSGMVVAFEPQPKLARYLVSQTGCGRFSNVTVVQKALSDRNGKATLFVPGGGISPGASLEKSVADRSEFDSYEVELTTLDSYTEGLKEQISAIKIDVDGHELSVLKGAENVLKEMAPALVVECEQRHLQNCSVWDVLEWVMAMGYEGWFVSRGQRQPLSGFDLQIHQPQGSGQYWNEKSYCNNFLFRKT